MTLAGYAVLVAALCMGALACGWFVGKRNSDPDPPIDPVRASWIWLAAVSLWVVLAISSRWYGDSGCVGWAIAERFAHAGKWYAFAVITLLGFGYVAGVSSIPRTHLVALAGISLCVFITVWKTFPVYPFIQDHVTRGEDGTVRQSTQSTCGPVALANAMDIATEGKGPNEKSLAMRCGTTCEGTTRWGVWRAALAGGFPKARCERMTLEELEKSGSDAIISIETLPGVNHAALYIGTFENVVILVDPQYGVCTMSRERFRKALYGNPIVLGNARIRKPVW